MQTPRPMVHPRTPNPAATRAPRPSTKTHTWRTLPPATRPPPAANRPRPSPTQPLQGTQGTIAALMTIWEYNRVTVMVGFVRMKKGQRGGQMMGWRAQQQVVVVGQG